MISSLRNGRLAMALAAIAALAVLSGCQATDVVAGKAKATMAALEPALELSVDSSSVNLKYPSGDWVRFALDLTGAVDATVSLDGTAFVAAGLDPARLPEGWALNGDRLEAGFDLASSGVATEPSLSGVIGVLGRSARERLAYHEELDHFGVELSPYLILEWAAEASQNDKDLVIVLAPELVSASGGDPSKVTGWILADIKVKGKDGSMVLKPKLLRPFQIIQ